ncbi:telomere repeats-binding bouquet formation protein 2 [Apus apus]|uniref:telomere repeats-binding bouquet formation protein 2 n=1 Tax=Apus apus TaxID=8895 RepID=UPI0021F8DA02|nr:telomere repeats-binding bouquet formation protein 2 [Apus apus]
MFRGHRAWFSQSVGPGPRALWGEGPAGTGGGGTGRDTGPRWGRAGGTARQPLAGAERGASAAPGVPPPEEKPTTSPRGPPQVPQSAAPQPLTPLPAAAGGGALAHPWDAEFLFSSDAAHPDTRRIHQSLDYLEGRATVFHSQFLSAWARSGAGVKPSLVLGHFILPPACLQEVILFLFMAEIRRKIGCFIWENMDQSLAEQPDENLMDEPEAVREASAEGAEDVLNLAGSEEETVSRAPSQGEFPYRALQEYPVNNMVTGYASARHMRKYTGELRDFTPGTSGYAVFCVQRGIGIYCDPRAKTKRRL